MTKHPLVGSTKNNQAFFVVLLLVSIGTSSFAPAAQAATALEARPFVQVTTNVTSDPSSVKVQKTDEKSMPVAQEETKPVKTIKIDMTAYTSSVEECDSDPFTAADGTQTYFGMVATNVLPFGTRIRMPELFGDKVFVVHDRMNARYTNRIDVWLEKKGDMRQFGLKKAVKVEILEIGDNKTQWARIAEENRLAREAKKAAALAQAKQKVELTAKITK